MLDEDLKHAGVNPFDISKFLGNNVRYWVITSGKWLKSNFLLIKFFLIGSETARGFILPNVP